MRLRSICTDYTRTTRRTLRLALVMALASSAQTTLAADRQLPGLPGPLPTASCADSQLLPYPFIEAEGSRAAVSRQLVKLLGLQRPADQPPRPVVAQASSPVSLPKLATPVASGVASSGSVVTASATEEQPSDKTAALPNLPTLPAPAASSGLGLSESLLDIEIPDNLEIPVAAGLANNTPAAAKSTPTAAVAATGAKSSTASGDTDCSKSTDRPEACAAGASQDQQRGVVQVCEPPALPNTDSSQASGSSSVQSAKQPAIVRSTKPMSLTAEKSASPAADRAVSMNLNDSPTDVAASSGRGAVLHLSSGSDDTELKAVTDLKRSQPSSTAMMQVRIEGEPAAEFGGANEQPQSLVRPALPIPMLQASLPLGTQARLAAADSSVKPVRAALASRTTPAMAQTSFAAQPASHVTKASSNALAVGLQESHTLSTDYTIRELSVENPTICQVLKTSDRSVSVIGMRPGATRIALISYNTQGERSVEVREVAVGEGAATAVNLTELADEISQTIAHMYPKSDVEVIAYQDYVMVRGFTNYESDAKKILALVRKTSLAPVVDQLTTSGN